MLDTLEEIRLIKNLSELQGTFYFEFLPGEFTGTAWNKDSAFIDESLFDWIEPAFSILPGFDHYSFATIHKIDWMKCIQHLKEMQDRIQIVTNIPELIAGLGLSHKPYPGILETDFDLAMDKFRIFIDDLIEWLQITLQTATHISILGI